jgi:hypothetical protein
VSPAGVNFIGITFSAIQFFISSAIWLTLATKDTVSVVCEYHQNGPGHCFSVLHDDEEPT